MAIGTLIRRIQRIPRERVLPLTLILLSLSGCGSRELDQSEVNAGSVLGERPATLREGGEPVTGTVVQKDAKGQLLGEVQYQDGFPNGLMREWYPDGKPKIEREVRYVDHGQNGGGLQVVGVNKAWCENGNLQSDQPADTEGKPRSEHKTWNCAGELLYEAQMPAGKFRRWAETGDGSVYLSEEGALAADGFLEGEHKQYAPDGTVLLIEHWQNGKQDGDYRRMNPNGSVAEAGRFEAGQHKGIWVKSYGDFNDHYIDYDPEDFNKQEYVAPFLQAAGIEASGNQARFLRDYQVDPEKLKYYVQQGLIDPKKALNLDVYTRYNEFQSKDWTYPYIRASRAALPVLLELGADPKARDAMQRTRLHYCVDSLYQGGCNAADIQQMIALGIDAGLGDNAGYTALHRLMFYTRVPDETSRYGQKRVATAADLKPLIDLLIKGGGDPDAPANDGTTPIMLALQSQMYDVAVLLLEMSKNPAQTDKEGLNLVARAFYQPATRQFSLDLPDDRRAFVELAVSKGVDPMQPINGDVTLVQLAEQNGAIEFAQYLRNLKTGSG